MLPILFLFIPVSCPGLVHVSDRDLATNQSQGTARGPQGQQIQDKALPEVLGHRILRLRAQVQLHPPGSSRLRTEAAATATTAAAAAADIPRSADRGPQI